MMDGLKRFDMRRIPLMQKTTQRHGMWKRFQAQQRWEQPIPFQGLDIFDATQASDQCKQLRHEQVDRSILASDSGPRNRFLQHPAQAKIFAKPVKQDHAPITGQACSIEGKIEISESFGHSSQYYPMGRFVRKPNDRL